MMVKKRPPHSKKSDTEFHAMCRLAYETMHGLPPELREELARISNEICDLGDKYQVPPLAMVSGVAPIIGLLALAMAEGNVHADSVFDDFVEFAHAALRTAVAVARIQNGWTPEDPS